MALPIYLAMTDQEYRHCPQLPEYIGWMACHFSSYSQGLSNIPDSLPENALLMVNDRIPPAGHDPSLIASQLCEAAEKLKVRGVVLDFQRSYQEELRTIAEHIQASLPCPVAISPAYSDFWQKAVLVPPVPIDQPPEEYLKPWNGKEIWLETEKAGICLTVTGDGCSRDILSEIPPSPVFEDKGLCCHYHIQVLEDRAVFSLYRTEEDQNALLSKANALGVSVAVGLYQEYR